MGTQQLGMYVSSLKLVFTKEGAKVSADSGLSATCSPKNGAGIHSGKSQHFYP